MINRNKEELKEGYAKGIRVLEKLDVPIEVRMLKTKNGTRSGYYEDKNKLLNDIIKYDGEDNIFFTLNVFSEDLLARGKDKLSSYVKHTTSDSEIIRRVLLLIDVDPERPAGISSTDEELESANGVAEAVKDFLTEKGFPQPVKACSGNGYHLLYKLDLPSTKEINDMIKDFLNTLDGLFSTEKAKIDKTTYNPARITKLYGTIACKGESTETRPHRRSRIIESPEEFKVVEENLISKVVEHMPKKQVKAKKQSKKTNAVNSFDAKEWLEKHEIEISHTIEKDYGLCHVLKVCPWNSNHTDTSASVTQHHDGGISAKCHHDSCSEENWDTLRERYEPKASRKKTEYSNKSQSDDDSKRSQADVLVDLVLENNDVFFHNSLEETFVAVDKGNFYEVHGMEDKKYQMLLRKRYYDNTQKAPSKDNINQAIGVLEAKALYEGEEIEVAKRCTSVENTIYYDIADKASTIIKIDENGWEIDDSKQILFIRKNNMKEQVIPEPYEDLVGLLEKHFRFRDEEDKTLHAVSLVTRLIPHIPHPIEVIHGEKGASKTTTMKMNRSLIDPASRDIISIPKAIQDLAITLFNNYMPCFDNLDSVSSEKSDLFCIASTGGGYSKRKLYTDDDEKIINFKSRITLNGINVMATRADLLDRCIVLALERIPENERKEEARVWKDFNDDKPKILGAMLTTLSKAMKIYLTVTLDKLGRMADFTRWGYAVAEACGIGGEVFLKAYLNNQKKANQEAVESNPIATALIKYMDEVKNFNGTVSSLLTVLNQVAEVEQIDTTSTLWAKEPNVLSRRLNEIKSNLELEGIYYEVKQKNYGRVIEIAKVA
ncbi:hypothetical protein [Clostridium sp. FP1]|uniref:hypothetical protein n=1 Tax=Clostridium sp. FP1 TaxID=2724076 RepID=UPI001CCD3652|nr:hypothetical protein [Clostridium sp. FP1]MBZ9633391.1 hypothetical protein [Clostridium sp. FP1]